MSHANIVSMFDSPGGRGRRSSEADEFGSVGSGRRGSQDLDEAINTAFSPSSPVSRRNQSITDDDLGGVQLISAQTTSPDFRVGMDQYGHHPEPIQWNDRDDFDSNRDSLGSRGEILSPPSRNHQRTRTAPVQDLLDSIFDVSSNRPATKTGRSSGSMGHVMEIDVANFFRSAENDQEMTKEQKSEQRRQRIENARQRKSRQTVKHQKSRSAFAGSAAALDFETTDLSPNKNPHNRQDSVADDAEFMNALAQLSPPANSGAFASLKQPGRGKRGSQTNEDYADMVEDQPVLAPPTNNAIQLVAVENDPNSAPIRGRRDSLSSSSRRKSVSSQARRQSFSSHSRRKSLGGRRDSLSSHRRRNSLLSGVSGGHRRQISNMSALSGGQSVGRGRGNNPSMMSLADLMGDDGYMEQEEVDFGLVNQDGSAMTPDQVRDALAFFGSQINEQQMEIDELNRAIDELSNELDEKDKIIAQDDARMDAFESSESLLKQKLRYEQERNRMVTQELNDTKEERISELTAHTEEIRTLKQRLRNQKAEIKSEERGNADQMQIELNDKIIDNQRLERHLARVQKELATAKENFTDMRLEKQGMERKLDQVTHELKETRTALSKESHHLKELLQEKVYTDQKAKELEQTTEFLNRELNEVAEQQAEMQTMTNLRNIQQEGSTGINPQYLHSKQGESLLQAINDPSIIVLPEEITEADDSMSSSQFWASGSESSFESSSDPPTPKQTTPKHTRTPSQMSLLTMPIHDGMREFFYLQTFCVKMKLSRLFGVTPDLCPPTHVLWKRAHQQKVMFHDYHDWLIERLSEVFDSWRDEEGALPTHGRVTVPGGPHPLFDTDLDFVYTNPDRPPSPERFGFEGFEEFDALDLGMDPITPAGIPTNPLPLYKDPPVKDRKKTRKKKKKSRGKSRKKGRGRSRKKKSRR